MPIVQIKTSCSATAWTTGCVWTVCFWPAFICPHSLLIRLKPITTLSAWSPSWNDNAASGGGSPTALVLCLVSLTVLDIILSHVAVISINGSSTNWYNLCYGYREAKGVERGVPTLAKWLLNVFCVAALRSEGQIKSLHTLTVELI